MKHRFIKKKLQEREREIIIKTKQQQRYGHPEQQQQKRTYMRFNARKKISKNFDTKNSSHYRFISFDDWKING